MAYSGLRTSARLKDRQTQEDKTPGPNTPIQFFEDYWNNEVNIQKLQSVQHRAKVHSQSASS